MHPTEARIGMTVTAKGLAGKTFKVTKLNAKTAGIENVDDEFEAYRAGYGLLTETPESAEEDRLYKAATADPVGVPYVKAVHWSKGMLAKAAPGSGLSGRMDGVRVVTNVTPTKIQLFPLGGSPDGRYWTVAPQSLVEVTVDELLGVSVEA